MVHYQFNFHCITLHTWFRETPNPGSGDLTNHMGKRQTNMKRGTSAEQVAKTINRQTGYESNSSLRTSFMTNVMSQVSKT